MGDLDRQRAVEQAAGGCALAVALLILVASAVVLLAWGSVATPILAAILICSGAGLAVVSWAARG